MRILNNFSKQNFKSIKSIEVYNKNPELRRVAQQLVDQVRQSNEIREKTADGEYNAQIRLDSRSDYNSKNLSATIFLASDKKSYQYLSKIEKVPHEAPDDAAAKAMLTYFSPKLGEWVQNSKAVMEIYSSTRDISPLSDYTAYNLNSSALYDLYCKNVK